jgi:dihydrofolate reductase
MPEIKLIAAIDNKLGLARDGKLPWDLPSDRKYFRDHVENGPVVMGWNTFVSNGLKPYGHGKNYVLTHKKKDAKGVELINNAQEFFIPNAY